MGGLCVHPLFLNLKHEHESVMDCICTQTMESMSLARGDVAYVGGQVARGMWIIVDGVLDYLPLIDESLEEPVPKDHWVSEAAFWTTWLHQGQLQASIETKVMVVDGAKFRDVVTRNGFVMALVKEYGQAFCDNMNQVRAEGHMLSDLQQGLTLKIPCVRKSHGSTSRST